MKEEQVKQAWNDQKEKLKAQLDNLLAAPGNKNEDVYLMMKELLDASKLSCSLQEYYKKV